MVVEDVNLMRRVFGFSWSLNPVIRMLEFKTNILPEKRNHGCVCNNNEGKLTGGVNQFSSDLQTQPQIQI